MAILIHADGTRQWLDLSGTDVERSDILHKAVGGYFELIYLPNKKVLFVNEDGLRLGLPPNPAATAIATGFANIAGDFILGDAVLCPFDEAEPPGEPDEADEPSE